MVKANYILYRKENHRKKCLQLLKKKDFHQLELIAEFFPLYPYNYSMKFNLP